MLRSGKVGLAALVALCVLAAAPAALAMPLAKTDVIKTSGGDLQITAVGHASIIFQYQGKVIHVDPWSKLADYGKLPKADLVIITHHHRDHLDQAALQTISKPTTVFLVSAMVAKKLGKGQVLANGQGAKALGLAIEAVPAYNLVHMRQPSQPFHVKGEGNGYVITFGDKRVYVAGDTENTPEMKALKNIEAAFLPMNLPYTMTQEMVADAAKAMKPRVLYPYHFDKSDLNKLKALLKDTPQVQVRLMTFSR